MIKHYHKFGQFGKWEMIGNIIPKYIGNYTGMRQFHLSIDDFAKIIFSVFGADGNKIGTVPSIIPPGGACGLPAVFVFVFRHINQLLLFIPGATSLINGVRHSVKRLINFSVLVVQVFMRVVSGFF